MVMTETHNDVAPSLQLSIGGVASLVHPAARMHDTLSVGGVEPSTSAMPDNRAMAAGIPGL